MSRLNIPFSSNSGTRHSTRSWRVLWLLITILAVFAATTFLANLWFNRDSLSGFAPKGTVATIHLTPNQKQWERLLQDFSNVPIISNRSLTIKDLVNYKPSELSILVLPNNQTAVAIRTLEKNLPLDVLSSLDVTKQKLGSSRWLLSSEVIDFSQNHSTKLNFGSIWPNNLGTITLSGVSGAISVQKTGYSFANQTKTNPSLWLPPLPTETIAAAVMPKNQNTDFSNLFQRFGLLLNPLEIIQSQDLQQALKNADSLILLAKFEETPEQTDFLIKTTLDFSTVAKLIQTSAALQNPVEQPLLLPDGSTSQEIVINKNPAETETVTINGKNVNKISTKNGEIFYLTEENNSIIASNQKLLEDFLLSSDQKKQTFCGSNQNLVFLNPDKLGSFMSQKDFSSNPAFYQTLLGFKNFVLNKNGFSVCN